MGREDEFLQDAWLVSESPDSIAELQFNMTIRARDVVVKLRWTKARLDNVAHLDVYRRFAATIASHDRTLRQAFPLRHPALDLRLHQDRFTL